MVTVVKTVRRWTAALLVGALGCPGGDADDPADTGESSAGIAALECVAPSGPDLSFKMEPAEFAPPQTHLDSACTVAEVDDGEPKILRLHCMNGLAPLDWRMSAEGMQLPLPADLVVGAEVELSYYTDDPFDVWSPVWQWAVVRPSGAADPSLIVVASPGEMPPTDATPAIEIVEHTTCDTNDGSCYGEVGRVAIRFSLEDVGETIVFDHDAGELAQYRMQVGDAIWDDGNCEGLSMNWYELAVVRGDVGGADG